MSLPAEQVLISADDHLDIHAMPPDVWSSGLPTEWRERGPHVEDERAKRRVQRPPPGDQHQVYRWRRSVARGPIRFPEAPPRPVPLYRPLHLAADGKPNAPSAAARLPQQDERWPLDPRPLPEHRLKIPATGEPLTPTPIAGQPSTGHR